MNIYLPLLLVVSCYVANSYAFIGFLTGLLNRFSHHGQGAYPTDQKRMGDPLPAGEEKRAMLEAYGRRKKGSWRDNVRKRKPSSCTAGYASLKESTMCAYEDSKDASDMGVSQSDIQEILNTHNDLRKTVAGDSGVEASDMQKMYWDDEMAKLAQKWVQVCKPGHDTNAQRKVPGYGIFVGQNWAAGQKSWTQAITDWYNEVKDFTYGGQNDLHAVGHFTQVVKNNAARVGCGFAKCGGRPTYVCDYAFGNANPLGTPYTKGPSCSACSSTCSDNLCDCNGKICLNGGSLDLNSCTCKCASVFSGDDCGKTDCAGKKDPGFCGKPQPQGFPKEYCDKFSNVPEDCPVMCGVC